MVFSGFVDDSGSGRGVYSGEVYVLAGFVSTTDRWKEFSDSFSAICDKEPKIEDFHMYEAYRPKSNYGWRDEKQRDERIAEVVNLIKEKALYRVDSVLAWPNYERIVKGRVPPEIDSPYFLLYYNIILAFAHFMDQANVAGSMAVILEAVTLGTSRRKRQNWIQAIEGLNGGLLIDAEHGRMLWRVQVEANDVSRLGFELRIVAGHVSLQAVRLQTSLTPDAMHGVFADAQGGS